MVLDSYWISSGSICLSYIKIQLFPLKIKNILKIRPKIISRMSAMEYVHLIIEIIILKYIIYYHVMVINYEEKWSLFHGITHITANTMNYY